MVSNCIISGNLTTAPGSKGADVFHFGGTFTRRGVNLIASTGTDSGQSEGLEPLNADPRLAALADHGGPALTMALLPGSPALDAAAASDIATDQRGLPRHGPPDIGAFESQTVP